MDWSEVQKAKVLLTQEVVQGLGEVEREILKQLLKHERRERNHVRPNFKAFYRDQLESRLPAPAEERRDP